LDELFPTSDFDSIRNATADRDGLIQCPVIPVRSTVVFPNMMTPFIAFEGRPINAVQAAMSDHRTVILLLMQDLNGDFAIENLHAIGTEIAVGQVIPYPEQQKTVLAQGRRRVEIVEFVQSEPYYVARARVLQDSTRYDDDTEALISTVISLFQTVSDLGEMIPEELLDYAMSIQEPGWLADFVGSSLTLSPDERQQLLETLVPTERLREVARFLTRELNMLELREEINGQVQQEMSRSQRELYLREQMRVIQTELGEEDFFQQEINDVRQQIAEADLPPEIREKAAKEMMRLSIMPPMAPEVGIIRTYIDWIVSLPWLKLSEDNLNMRHAQQVLDEDHYGLTKIKDRILEHIAVRKLAADKMKTPILCFVGPPGVGKTSLGKSIAKALGRAFVRVSLGGVRDEAEIRGHRRTYIGAMPGRIIQTMRRAGTINPVFMLDEIDKIGADFRGDPAAALLEVLDPEQNTEYSDHYLDVPYNLSKVMFITTANELYNLPPALVDRLEVIEFPGYPEEEKLAIARQFLIPQQLEGHGLTKAGLKFELSALQTLIREYSYEAGVRNLNREIANVCRKVARLVAEEKAYPHRITAKQITTFLGPPEYIPPRVNDVDSVGLATGLAWTFGGGDILSIEVSVLPGKGQLMMTGQLGEVMQESAQAAMSYMRARALDLNVPAEDFEEFDVHVHLPEGAVPKDGPSAGITLAAAIISAFTERKIRSNFAMTGEITLRGRVLPVGGIKEKLLAAHRAQIAHVILPALNQKDLVDVPKNALRTLKVHFVEDMQQVMDLVLLEAPSELMRDKMRPKDETEDEKKTTEKKAKSEKKAKKKEKNKALPESETPITPDTDQPPV
jgi:ATP-dependent Lon protease